MTISIDVLRIEDYEAALALWQRTPGMGLSSADEKEAICSFLERNPGMSFMAWKDGQLVGTAMCGHDGRRGYVYHVAVDPLHRKQGIGTMLVDHCLAALRSAGIRKAHLMVYLDNMEGIAFWERIGWYQRAELTIYSTDIDV